MMKWLVVIIYCFLAIPSWGTEVAESEIPIQLEAAKKNVDNTHALFRILGSVAIIGMLGAASVLYLRKYRAKSVQSAEMPNIKVLTQHYLGPKKSLALVRVAGESILIGVTEQNITLIKSLSLLDEDIPNEMPTQFEKTLQSASSDEEFSMTGIKDFVANRLKNMRTI